VDFAAWCSYKYLNSGPGSVAGCFIHERHLSDRDIPRFEGWWGHDKQERFKMERTFKPMPTAEAWQLSNAPVFSMAIHRVALDLFDKAGMDALRKKSLELSAYLEMVIKETADANGAKLEIITPRDPLQRGAQVSVIAHGQGKELFDSLMEKGVFIDWREPNVLRMAPVPMYNSFRDVYRFGRILSELLSK
jgi:kynureninase